MSSPKGSNVVNFLQGTSNSHFEACNFVSSITYGGTDPWSLFYAEIAPNAILNAGGRADPVRCYPGTREEVISKIEQWMTEGYREDRRIFWLSGPAGAGKSAIVQTLAENCSERGAAMANFFFFRADPSRAQSRPLVATLLHQLLELYPDLTSLINSIISQNRLVFKKPLRDQFLLLIDGPIRALRRGMPHASPIILLIDGLDECDSRPNLDSATMLEQTTLLKALDELVTPLDSPFIAVVASRVESHIQMAFNRIGCSKNSIFLNSDYQPDKDIRHYISAQLSIIKESHPLGHYLPMEWPSNATIDCLVGKSSGQFIYAATAVRFTEYSSQSPAISVDMLLNIHVTAEHSPFAEIDALYIFILARCKHWQRASELIALDRLRLSYSVPLPLSGYNEHEAASFFSDLTPIIDPDISQGKMRLTFHHWSFEEFLYSTDRAGKFHIDLPSSANCLAPRVILGVHNMDTFAVAAAVMMRVHIRNNALTHALTHLPLRPLDVPWHQQEEWAVKNDFLRLVKKLYAADDPHQYKEIFDHMKKQDWIPISIYLDDVISFSDSYWATYDDDDSVGSFEPLDNEPDDNVKGKVPTLDIPPCHTEVDGQKLV